MATTTPLLFHEQKEERYFVPVEHLNNFIQSLEAAIERRRREESYSARILLKVDPTLFFGLPYARENGIYSGSSSLRDKILVVEEETKVQGDMGLRTHRMHAAYVATINSSSCMVTITRDSTTATAEILRQAAMPYRR